MHHRLLRRRSIIVTGLVLLGTGFVLWFDCVFVRRDLGALLGAFTIRMGWYIWFGLIAVCEAFERHAYNVESTCKELERPYGRGWWCVGYALEGIWIGLTASMPLVLALVYALLEQSISFVFYYCVPPHDPYFKRPVNIIGGIQVVSLVFLVTVLTVALKVLISAHP